MVGAQLPASSQCPTWNLVTKHVNPLLPSTPPHPFSLEAFRDDLMALHLPAHLRIITFFPPNEETFHAQVAPPLGNSMWPPPQVDLVTPTGGSDHSLACSHRPVNPRVCAGVSLAHVGSTAVSPGLGMGWAHPCALGSLSRRSPGDRDVPRSGDLRYPLDQIISVKSSDASLAPSLPT